MNLNLDFSKIFKYTIIENDIIFSKMKKTLMVQYNLDKLTIYYESTEQGLTLREQTLIAYLDFTPSKYENQYGLLDIWPKIPSLKTFIIKEFQTWQGKFRLINPIYTLVCEVNGEEIIIGKLKTHLSGAMVLEVANEFLYTGNLNLLQDFEKTFSLTFHSIREIDICCDANIDLPRKLKTKLQNKDTYVTRRGSKRNFYTRKKNIRLGMKRNDIIKIITEKEISEPSLYFNFKPSGGNKQEIELIGYNKSEEIEISKKDYIIEQLSFEGTVHRLEIALKSSHLKYFYKKFDITPLDIYHELPNNEFLRFIFIENLNRFFIIRVKGIKTTLSEILCLD